MYTDTGILYTISGAWINIVFNTMWHDIYTDYRVLNNVYRVLNTDTIILNIDIMSCSIENEIHSIQYYVKAMACCRVDMVWCSIENYVGGAGGLIECNQLKSDLQSILGGE